MVLEQFLAQRVNRNGIDPELAIRIEFHDIQAAIGCHDLILNADVFLQEMLFEMYR